MIAVIFSSELFREDPEYSAAAGRMEELAKTIPGYLGIESYRNGLKGVSISYWENEDAIVAWRAHPDHVEVQSRGRKDWYKNYTLRVAKVVRQSSK